jgi:hypothetical protein
MSSMRILSLTAGLLVAVCGCGPKGPPMGTVSGKLTIGGAAPTEPTRVTFINNSIGQGAGGTVGNDGSYSLEAPLPPAEYTVFVSKVLSDTGGPVSTAKELLMSVPKEFRSEETSPLKHAVKEGKNEINIEIPAAQGGK